jgi:hypothetical protein
MEVVLVGPIIGNALHGAEVGIFDALVELGHHVLAIDPRVDKQMNSSGEVFPIDYEAKIHANIILCPGAGIHGGEVVVSGELDKLLTAKNNYSDSLTLAYLRGEKKIEIPEIGNII